MINIYDKYNIYAPEVMAIDFSLLDQTDANES